MISIIMLTYNRKEYVQYMIEDILRQSYKDFEYIIVNNGSIDGTDEILDKYAKADKRIKVIEMKQAQTIGRGRNIGLENAQGDFIAFVDDDDRVDEDFLEFLVRLQEEEQADIAMCGCDEFENGIITPQCVYDEKYVLNGEEAVILLLEREKVRAGMPTKLVKRKLFMKYPFVEECKSEDAHNAYKYFADAQSVVLYGIPKYHIRRHETNNSRFTSDFSEMTQRLLKEYLQLYKDRTRYLIEKFPQNKSFFEYNFWSFELSMCEKVIENHLRDCEAELKEMLDDLRNNTSGLRNCQYLKEYEEKRIKKYVEYGAE